jgi:uncharacterized protein YbjT (DUF2867 family)
MTGSVLVTGGTGTLGRLVVPRLKDAGLDVRVLTRRPRPDADGVRYLVGDLATGEGVPAAVDGVETVVHCAGGPKGDDDLARTLVGAATAAGSPHVVYVSVVGADRVPLASAVDRGMFGYFGGKRGAEEVIAGSGLPWTTLRATQFYDLILLVAKQMARLPVVPVPAGFRFQPVDTDEVAARLVDLALGAPAGLVPDIGGPRVYPLADLVRGYLRATGRRRPIVPLPLPGRAARAVRDGAVLTPEHATGKRTWEQFLAEQVSGR